MNQHDNSTCIIEITGKPRCTVKQRKPNQQPHGFTQQNTLHDFVEKVQRLKTAWQS